MHVDTYYKTEATLQLNPNLKDKTFDSLLANIFASALPVLGKDEILIMGKVEPDGKGDWLFMLNMEKELKKNFRKGPYTSLFYQVLNIKIT